MHVAYEIRSIVENYALKYFSFTCHLTLRQNVFEQDEPMLLTLLYSIKLMFNAHCTCIMVGIPAFFGGQYHLKLKLVFLKFGTWLFLMLCFYSAICS